MAEIATRTTNMDELGPNGWSVRDEITLLICGEGNLVPVAKLLHQRALEGRPLWS